MSLDSVESDDSQKLHDRAFDEDTSSGNDDTVKLSLSSNDQLIGTIFAEKYQVLSLLGSGGMSEVYKVEHVHLKSKLALKLLHKHLWSDPLAVDRFKKEAKSINELKHENLIEYLDYGVYKNQPYLIMAYLEGESLEAKIRQTRGLSIPICIDILESLCKGLAFAHQAGIIHRDIKPANVLLQSSSTHSVKLVDFGIAKLVDENPTVQLTQTGEIFGSPPYMSPEQCQGLELDKRSDIYSLGCLFYEALTGQLPVTGANLMEVINNQMAKVPELPSKVKPSLNDENNKGIKLSDVEYMVMRCLEKDRSERYSCVEDLLADIQQIQSRSTIKKKTLSKRVIKKNALKLFLAALVLTPICFYSGYYLHKGFQYLVNRGFIHSSCMARIWLSDIGVHLDEFKGAKWFLDSALDELAREKDPYDARNLKLDIYLRLYTIYEKQGNQEMKDLMARKIRLEIRNGIEVSK